MYLLQYELQNFYSYNPKASLQKEGEKHTHTSMNNIFVALEGDISPYSSKKKKNPK